MPEHDKVNTLLIVGVHSKSEAYPNVLHRIQALKNNSDMKVEEINYPLWPSDRQHNINYKKSFTRLFRYVFIHLVVWVKYIFNKNKKNIYVPYPSVMIQFLISFLPGRLKPELSVIDAFISLYDTVIIDRRLAKENTWLARILFKVERRAFFTANYVAVDTALNAEYLSALYELPVEKFIVIPLATNEVILRPSPYTLKSSDTCSVLFIGTLIPLHGIKTIMAAIKLVGGHNNIKFHIIGDGQDERYVRECSSSEVKNITWTKDWQTTEALSSVILQADICLGVFGETGKAQRICPYKIFHYARIGRPIITAQTNWTDSISGDDGTPFSLVDAGDSQQLADRILLLEGAPDERLSLARKSGDFYNNYLAVSKSTNKLINLFEG